MTHSLIIIAQNSRVIFEKLSQMTKNIPLKDFPLRVSGVVLHDLSESENLASQYPGLKIYSSCSDSIWSDQKTIFWICDALARRSGRLKEIAKLKPTAVICEPPFTTALDETLEIVGEYISLEIPLVINYARRFCPRTQQIVTSIKNGLIGRLLGGNAYYSSGLMSSGILLLDLIQSIFDMPTSVQAIPEGTVDGANPIVGGHLIYHHQTAINLQGINVREYDLFELDLCGDTGRIQISGHENNCQVYLVDQNGHQLTSTTIPFCAPEKHPDLGVLRYVNAMLTKNIAPTHSAFDGISTLRTALALQRSYLRDGEKMNLKKLNNLDVDSSNQIVTSGNEMVTNH